MASIAELFVSLKGDNSDFNKAVAESQRKLKAFSDTATKVGKGLNKKVTLPLAALATGFVLAADKQEKAEAALTNAIRATGKEAEISLDSLKEYTAGLQEVTLYGDEAQLSALALVQQLADLNEDGLKAVLPGILDFSAAMGVDLQTAASLVGKTLGSSTNALARYGIELSDTTDPTERLAELTEQLETKFNGAADAAASAGLGPVTQLKNSIGDLAESFGSILIPELNKIVVKIQGVVGWFSNLDDEQKKLLLRIGGIAAAIGPLVFGLGKFAGGIGKLIGLLPTLRALILTLNTAVLANPYAAAAAAVILLGTVIFNLTKNMRQEAKERADLLDKQEKGIELTDKERLKIAEMELVRLRDTKARQMQALEAAKSLGQNSAALKLIQDNIDKTQENINVSFANVRAIGAEIEAKTRYADKTEEVTDDLVDNTEELKLNTDATDENREVIEEWGDSVETVYAGYGRAAQVTVAQIVDAEKRAHEDRLARIDAEKKAEEDKNKALLAGANAIYGALGNTTSAYFDYKLSLYDADSEEYKQAQLDQFNTNKAISAVNTAITGAEAAMKIYTSLSLLGPVVAGIGAAAVGVLTAAQVGFILAQQIPSFAQGGIVNPTPGGTIAQVAEAGQPEVIFPLDRLDEFLTGDAGAGGGNIYLTVEMDSAPILEKIFPATRNRQILIDARAVV